MGQGFGRWTYVHNAATAHATKYGDNAELVIARLFKRYFMRWKTEIRVESFAAKRIARVIAYQARIVIDANHAATFRVAAASHAEEQ